MPNKQKYDLKEGIKAINKAKESEIAKAHSGVYMMCDGEVRILYIGKAKNYY